MSPQKRKHNNVIKRAQVICKTYAQLLKDKQKEDTGVFRIISTTENLETLAAKEQALTQIHALRKHSDSNNEAIGRAINKLCGILENGLVKQDPTAYFNEQQDLIKEYLETIQYSNASLMTSVLNVIATVLVCCATVSTLGLAHLWLSGVLKQNYATKGDHLLFSTKGEKQQAKELIHQVKHMGDPPKHNK